ncbi:MAG: thioredoxin domain-containing protein [Pseudanabaenaceae cyanobacterium]
MRLFSASLAMALVTGAIAPAMLWAHGNQGHGSSTGKAAATSVGDKLAAELQGKPVMVQIKSRNCPMCRAMEPTLAAIKDSYRGRVTFVTLDVTDAAAVRAAEQVAIKAGLQNFFRANQTRTGLLLAVNPASGEVWEQFRSGTPEAQITAVLDRAIAELAERK